MNPRTYGTRLAARLLGAALALAALGAAQTAPAQSTLFNVPTTDVLSPGSKYLEADFDARPVAEDDGGWQSYGGLFVYGVRKRLEVGVNGYYMRAAGGAQPLELQPNAKWQLYSDEGSGVAAAAGVVFYVPVTRRAGTDTFAHVYATASKKVRGDRGPRLTAGGYKLLGFDAGSGTTAGALFAVEQPVHRRLTFIADWSTGRNRFGYAAAGFGLSVTKRTYLSAAYYFGNEGRGNNSLGVYYGISF